MRNSISIVQYLLFALLLLALTGCGASNKSANLGTPVKLSAKVAIKTTAKSVASAAQVSKVQLVVTGASIPTAKGDKFNVGDTLSVEVYPGADLIVAAYGLDASGATIFEGFVTGLTVAAGTPTNLADPIQLVPVSVKAQDSGCVNCHENTRDVTGQNLVANFKQSGHYANQTWNASQKLGITGTGCAGCHGPSHNDTNPSASGRCGECHNTFSAVAHNGNAATNLTGAKIVNQCITCHQPHNTKTFQGAGCTICHSVGQQVAGNFVNDNNGVRAITTEFDKWSHHVTGVTLNDAHCAACHLEGKVSEGNVVVDPAYHMADNQTHLRNADDDSDMQWNPAAPSFTTMDNFCLSCHDADGATSPMSAKIQAYINAKGLAAAGKTAKGTNPFGDTISNQYDKLERPAVVDAAGQFATTNPSHHAVKGKKYTGRTRAAGARQIADVAAFTANSSAALPGARSTIYDAGKFEATYTTLADAAGETGARNGGSSLGDDSTLHCGDCHTVGQFRAADAAPGNRYNKAVIGAHGSNNEYLLRNNLGTDEKHTGAKFAGTGTFGADIGYGNMPYLVCYNCHTFATYGSAFGTSGAGHAAEYDVSGRCNGAGQTINSVYGNMTGESRLKTFKTNAVAYGTPDGNTFGNIFGIECNNCHNSGVAGNMFGGIHGSKEQTYTDGAGNTTKHRRFLPGLGNTMFVPGTRGGVTGGSLATYMNYSGNRNGTGTGGTTGQTFTLMPVRDIRITGVDNGNGSYQYVTGGVTNDLNWEQKSQQPIAGQTSLSAKAMGCYTLTPNGTPKISNTVAKGYPADDIRYAATEGQKGPDGRVLFDVWGGCDDHNGAQGAGTNFTRKVLCSVSY